MQLPSKTNTIGSLAGLVAGVVANKLVAAGVVASIAAFIGCPPATITMAVTVLVASLVNYGVTHYGTLQNWDNIISILPNKAVDEFPQDYKGSNTINNLQPK